LSDGQWTELARTTARQTADGKWRLKYDPGIAVPFRSATPGTTDLWAIWDALRCPTLLLRGAESDLLSPDTAAAMRARGPKPRLVEFPGVGHAPMLLTPEQITPVAAFLESR
jgi:pimeloyl-ACP methyl ester carboxylesterase